LTKRRAAIYAFFNADPEIEFAKNGTPEYLAYCCANCGLKIRQGLKMADRGSTGEHQPILIKMSLTFDQGI